MPTPSRRVRVDTSGIYRPHLRDGLVRRPVAAQFSAIGGCVARLRADPVLPPLPRLARVQALVAALQGPCAVVGSPGAVRAVTALPMALGMDGGLRRVDSPDTPVDGEGTWVALLGPAWVADVVDRVVAAGGRVLVVGPGDEDEEVTPPPGGHWLSDPIAADGRFGATGAAAWVVAGLCGVSVEELDDAAIEARRAVESQELAGHPSWPMALGVAALASEQQREDAVHLHGARPLRGLARWAAGVFASVLADATRDGAIRERRGGRGFAADVGDEEVVEALVQGSTAAYAVTWEHVDAEQIVDFVALAHEEGLPVIRVRFDTIDLRGVVTMMVAVQHAAVGAALLLRRDPRRFDGALRLRAGVRTVDAGEGAE